jgi:transposase
VFAHRPIAKCEWQGRAMDEGIVFGVDSHAASLAVCGVDQAGRRICASEYPNSADSHVSLLEWARQQAPEGRRFGIEGAGGYAHAFAQFLLAAGELVVEVPASLTRRERRYGRTAGKSDAGDALAIARVTLREERLPRLRQAGPSRDLKLLYDYRRQLTAERTRVANRLHADLGALAPGYRDRARHLTTKATLASPTAAADGKPGASARISCTSASMRRYACRSGDATKR